MKSWIQEISKKYIEQNYIITENNFHFIARILKEAKNIVVVDSSSGEPKKEEPQQQEPQQQEPQCPKKPRSPRKRKYIPRTPAQREARRKKDQEKAAKDKEDKKELERLRSGANMRDIDQKAADLIGNDNINVQGDGNTTIVDRSDRSNRSSVSSTTNNYDNRRWKFVNIIKKGGGSGEREPKKLYRVERRLRSVIGPVTRAIGVVKGVGSGLDKMMGGAGGVLSGAEEIGNTLTPSTSKQLQLYRQLGKQLTPDEIAILTGKKKP